MLSKLSAGAAIGDSRTKQEYTGKTLPRTLTDRVPLSAVAIWSSIPPRCRIRQRLSFFKNFSIAHNSDDVAIRHPYFTPGCSDFRKFRSRGYCGFRLIRASHRREGHSRGQDLANFASSEPAAWRPDLAASGPARGSVCSLFIGRSIFPRVHESPTGQLVHQSRNVEKEGT